MSPGQLYLLTSNSQQPLANLLELKTVITGMDLDKERGILVTVCEEKTIKVGVVKNGSRE